MTTDEVAERRYQNLSAPKITPLTYDPVELGLIDRPRANSLLKLFKTSFTPSFPFVVVPAATDLDTFRRQKPFLFHAIMTIMTFKTPALQKRLASDLLEQISSRIILRSHKSLEIVQGLLVFSGWYHFFYRPECQQMANTIQLCVAMVQDLGLTKRGNGSDTNGRSAAEKRALLGTFYVNTTYSQVWRKRTTMSFTKFMGRCSDSLSEDLDEPTDGFIRPLIQLSDLICRVGEHFSYDDSESAEFTGEIMMETLTSNFVNELLRIKQSAAQLEELHHLTFCVWAGWFYGVILGCRLVFLQGNELHRQTCWESLPGEITKMFPHNQAEGPGLGTSVLSSDHYNISTWHPVAVAEEAEILHLFTRLLDKLSFTSTTPGDPGANGEMDRSDRDTLLPFMWVQHCIYVGFHKRIKEYASRPPGVAVSDLNINTHLSATPGDASLGGTVSSSVRHGQVHLQQQMHIHPSPFLESLSFQSLDFETIQPPTAASVQPTLYEDFVWDISFDDMRLPHL
ncbi:hypothetical protein B0J11DRAFT_429636 [Dendryphion nanum]|uniref:Transcription factor domain-containing protein n=1 Tax=Dendryphion nanum TaxID=256645 RepID=A0A9P9E2I7_9PLEO|nr:hypothetical protein B0J11DRAFT_429636 [Dendryphion nanum]